MFITTIQSRAAEHYGSAFFYSNQSNEDFPTVITPFKHDLARQIGSRESGEGLPNQEYEGASTGEIAAIWQILNTPATDQQQILERQAVMTAMIENPKQLRALADARSEAYAAAGLIKSLLAVDEEEHNQAISERGRPRNRLRVLFEAGFPTTEEEIQKQALQIRYRSDSEEQRQKPEEAKRNEVAARLAEVSNIQSGLTILGQELAKLNHPRWREISAEYLETIAKLPPISSETLMQLVAKNDEAAINRLSEAYGVGLFETITRVCALIQAGRVIAKNCFAKPTFDESESEHFEECWNVLKEKGPGTHWSFRDCRPYEYRQVMNNSPKPHGETYLCGSQMSGKSFTMDSWFYLGLWGQSFGYIPAKSGNIRIAPGFVFMHRLGSEVTSKDKSSFQTEAETWAAVLNKLDKLPPGSIVYLDLTSDEAFSTTSPVDQYRLLVGVVHYLRKRGIRVVLATHNDAFLALKEGQPDVGIYHLGVDTSEEFIRYTHVLKEGRDRSYALEVAKRMGVPDHVLHRASEFLKGNPLPLKPTRKKIWRLESYSEKERAEMKKKPLSFRFLWPSRSEAIIRSPDTFRTYQRLKWLVDEERSWSNGYGEPTLEPNRELGTLTLSNDRLMRAEQFRFKTCRPESPNNEPASGELLMAGHCPAEGSKEVLERQKLFDELLEGNRAEQLIDLSAKAGYLLWSLHHIHDKDWKRFPHGIMQELAATRPFGDYEQAEKWQTLLDTISAFGEALDIEFSTPLINKARERLEQLLELLNRQEELNRRHWSKEISPEEYQKQYRELQSEAGTDSDLFAAAKGAASLLAAQAEGALEGVTLQNFNASVMEKRLGEMWDRMVSGGFYDDPVVKLKRAYWLFSSRAWLREPLELMRETDSVYLHGFANYLEEIQKATIGVDLKGSDLRKIALSKEDYDERFSDSNLEILCVEWYKLENLARFAKELKDSNYCRVSFNDSGNFVAEAPWPVTVSGEEFSKYVLNDTRLDGGFLCELLESPNGSGKTHYIRQLIWLARCALATGYAPAKGVTMPPFYKVAYLDRVASNLDQNLSAYGNEVQQWLKLPIHRAALAHGGWLIGIDEAGSSTDPHSQGGVCDGLIGELVEDGNIVVTANHNHDWIQSFTKRAKSYVQVSHFATEVENGKVLYDYKKRPGPAPSRGLEVGAACGLPAEAIETGLLAPDVSFAFSRS